MLDEALLRPGRFDTVIKLPLPDQASRLQIFAVHLRKKPLRQPLDLEKLARDSQGLSGAEIAGICQAAARRALRRCLRESAGKTPGVLIEAQDVEALLQELTEKKGRAS
jgi:transitional endoplasmic reticulum ATPase